MSADPTLPRMRAILAASRGVLDGPPDSRLRLLAPAGRDPVELHWGAHETLFGPVLAAAAGDGLCWLNFIRDDAAEARARLANAWPKARLTEDPAATADAVALAFRPGTRLPEPLPLRLYGTQFQRAVWQALLRIPEGALVTYGDLAAAVGRPKAVRAAGSAVGANPVAVLVPCHRVIGKTGFPFKYAGGPERKRALLARELSGQSPSTSAMP